MAEIEEVAGGVVRRWAGTVGSARVVDDAFVLALAPKDEYIESEVAIERLEFSAFAVGGLAATAVPPTAGVRASSEVTLPLSDDVGGTAESRQTITLYGPGDVRGIDPAQIVRRYPAPGTRTAEETVLAHIELDRPELPWAFSAAAPTNPLRPWLTLLVLPKAAVRWLPSTLLPQLEVPTAELPSLTDAHLWAHTQVTQSETASLTARLSPEFAPVNLSRLLSPRVLREETDYLAALVPTTDVGVRGGRGLTGGTLAPAWTPSSGDTVVLPVYDSWEFRTGPDGDFATLALRLSGVPAPYEVGRMVIDASEPGAPLTSLPDGQPGAKQVLRCALYSPNPPPPEHVEAENAAWPAPKTTELRGQLDRAAELEGAQEPSGPVPDVPILGPHVYAALHRGQPQITGNDWFAELNLSPTHRIAAGLGTRVVQRDQEQLMQAAWAQVGDVERANRAIALAQLAELLATRLHARISALVPTRLLQVAAPLATRVSLTSGTTLAAQVAASATPATVLSGAFRRSVRPTGPVLAATSPATRAHAGELVGSGATGRDFTRSYRNPDGITTLTAESITALEASRVAEVLAVPRDRVQQQLSTAAGAVRGGLLAQLVDTSTWHPDRAGTDAALDLADQWGKALLRKSPLAAVQAVREQRTAPLIAELATVPVTTKLDLRETLAERAKTLNNSLVSRLTVRTDIGGGAGRGIEIVNRNPIGGAVARVGVHGLRDRLSPVAAPPGRAGRATTGAQVGRLSRITSRTPAAKATKALVELASLADQPLSPVLEQVKTIPVGRLKAAVATLIDPGHVLAIDPVPRRTPLALAPLASALDPKVTVRSALRGRLHLPEALTGKVFRPEGLRQVMAAPTFRRPMYQALGEYSMDWLIPGLGLLPGADFVTVLSTNSEFIEAFLVGLSDEMGRELRWRDYPTDSAGTYFRRFWDAADDELSQQIHAFAPTRLGSHIALGGDGGSAPRAVIVVKSELVRRYPDVIIQAVQNHGTPAEPRFDGPEAVVARQLFSAHLPPDFALIGIDLSLDELDSDAWWITIAEHPTATRFDRPRDEDLGAQTFLHVPGATSGADYAAERLHDPVRVAFHATDLLLRED